MRICSDQPCIVLLTEKDVWIRVNGKEPISLKANHMALLNCENNIIDVSSLNNTLVAHISHDIIKDYLRFLNKDPPRPVLRRDAARKRRRSPHRSDRYRGWRSPPAAPARQCGG